ncbi:MAG TPA: universal stress protein [Methanomicrobiales archaeon]|nr:universal stress protein [Methanomicrobiales archaeon]
MGKIFGKILIATDGSGKNRPAVEKGLEIARACGAAVCALYVIDETPLTSAQAEVLTADVYSALKEEGDRAVEQVRRMATGLAIETYVLSGRPAHVITGFAEKNGVDLIVVGSQGKSGLERLLLGSTAESIIRMAGCMVLVVKSG